MMYHGKPAIDRYTWTRFDGHAKVAAHFEESLSGWRQDLEGHLRQ